MATKKQGMFVCMYESLITVVTKRQGMFACMYESLWQPRDKVCLFVCM